MLAPESIFDLALLIKQRRLLLGMSQKQLEFESGLSARSISGVETMKHFPDYLNLLKILGALELELVIRKKKRTLARVTH